MKIVGLISEEIFLVRIALLVKKWKLALCKGRSTFAKFLSDLCPIASWFLHLPEHIRDTLKQSKKLISWGFLGFAQEMRWVFYIYWDKLFNISEVYNTINQPSVTKQHLKSLLRHCQGLCQPCGFSLQSDPTEGGRFSDSCFCSWITHRMTITMLERLPALSTFTGLSRVLEVHWHVCLAHQ